MSVELTFSGQFAILTLNRPESLNALNFATLRALSQKIEEIKASTARGLVVVGAGAKAFCAGADIKELMNRDLTAQREGALLGQRAFGKLAELTIPSVAVIHGYAFGGGLELALACTFRIVTAKAKMGLPEIKLGLIPGYGGTQRLPRVVGEARALELIMSGRSVDAAEAVQIGLASKVTENDEPITLGKSWLEPLLGFSRCATQFAREAVQRGMSTTLSEGLRIEADLSTLAYQTKDAAEGMSAFVEKRPPVFKDA